MDVADIRLLSVAGLLVVGVVTIAGAMAVSFLAAWFGRLRGRAGELPRPARADRARDATPGLGFDVEGEHAPLARQAQRAPQVPQASWGVRC